MNRFPLRTLLAVCALLLLNGCGGGNPFTTLPIRGKVTYSDGTPIQSSVVTVHFLPSRDAAKGSDFPQPALTVLNPDGTFEAASTFAKGDGAIPGEHTVVIEATNSDFTPNPSAVAAIYSDPAQSPLRITVKPEGENKFDLTVERGK